jgi:Ca2+-transporting ATPase
MPRGAVSWHALRIEDVLEHASSTRSGLAATEAGARLARDGPNALPPPPPTPVWRVLWNQVASVITLLLVAAAIIAALSGDTLDSVAILAVLVVNVALGLATELPARRAMHALLSLEVPRTTVLRDGQPEQIEAQELVRGDVIVLEAGQSVPADARLLDTVETRTTEATLTGESLPVAKDADALCSAETPLAERRNMIYRATAVADGAARAVVVETGRRTEIGRIGALIAALPIEPTPLERRLAVLGRRLAIVALSVAALVAALGRFQGRSWGDVLQLGLALGIAAVPEGLAIVATVALAIGMRRMARRRALVRRLAIVETLGSTTIVCTDKTGTLTTGQMTATTVVAAGRTISITGAGYAPHGVFHELGTPLDPAEHAHLLLALRTAVLASAPQIAIPELGAAPVGDPTEIALLVAAAKADLVAPRLRAEAGPLAGHIPFSSARRYMALHYREPDGRLVAYLKGAPDRVAERCALSAEGRHALETTNHHLAAQGLRLLGLAYGAVSSTDEAGLRDLSFVGFVGLADPPAEGVERALQALREAGIRTVMLTGDQRATAEEIARRLGVAEVHSRVTPEEKLRIVAGQQHKGEIVAMLGDGVNDAPALKKADIGVAMGRGSDIAKAAAGLVLLDDRFETVAAAVEEGRVIFDNLRKFVFYLFSCNLGEIFVFLGAGLAGWPAPLLPLQVLWLNVVTDTFPALALAFEPAERNVMRRPPVSPQAAILSGTMAHGIAGYAALIALSTLAAAWWGRHTHPDQRAFATTVAFMTLAVTQALHLGNARSREPVLAPSRIIANGFALAAVALVLGLQFAAAHWAPLADVLGTVPLGWRDWVVVVALGTVPALVGQVGGQLGRRRTPRSLFMVASPPL